MKNKAFWRAMYGLSHPLSMGAILLLLLNDHFLKRSWPSWWTGKISDFAWLLFAPFVLAALLAWLIPPRLARQGENVGRLAFALTGVGFALAKTLPLFHTVVVRLLVILTGWKVALRRDPTDLLAMPVLLVGWYLWRRRGTQSPSPSPRSWVVLALAVLATVATSPLVPDYGITCLVEQDARLFALQQQYSYGYASLSEDGGFTWQESPFGVDETECTKHIEPWQISDPANERVQYRFTPGVAVERSEDGGQTWHREVSLSGEEARTIYYEKRYQERATITVMEKSPGPMDALVHRATGNVVVAMGHSGVLVRTADAQWHWVPVGPYYRAELNSVDKIFYLLSGEFWLSLVLTSLTVSTMARRTGKTMLWDFWLVVAWVIWGITVTTSPAIYSIGLGELLVNILTILSALVAVPLGLKGAFQIYDLSPRALGRLGGTAVSGMLLFLLPYVLWSQGSIPRYGAAVLFALLLVAATLFAGDRYLQRSIHRAPLPAEVEVEKRLAAPSRAHTGWAFSLQWMVANVVGWAVGWVVFWQVSWTVFQPVGRAVGGAVVGACVGIMQWFIPQRRVYQTGWWVLASVVGWAVFETMFEAVFEAVHWAGVYRVGWAAELVVFGTMFGALFGILQWLILRRKVYQAEWWVLANTAGWAAFGLAFQAALSRTVYWGRVWGMNWIVVLVAFGAVFGTLWGTMQWLILRRQVHRTGWWVLANVVGWAVGWAVSGAVTQAVDWHRMGWVVKWAVAGAVFGVLFGTIQWLILRRKVSQAGWWVLANAVGWAVGWGMGWGVDEALGGMVGAVVAGMVVGAVGGAITGIPLVWLLQRPVPEA